MQRIFGAVICLAATTSFVSNTNAGTLPGYLSDVLSDVLGDERFEEIIDLVDLNVGANLDVRDYIDNIRDRYGALRINIPHYDPLPIYEIPTFDDSHINAVLANVRAARERARTRIDEIVEASVPDSHIPRYPISYGPARAAVQRVLDRIETLALANGISLFDPFAATGLILGDGPGTIVVDEPDWDNGPWDFAPWEPAPWGDGALVVGYEPVIGSGKWEMIASMGRGLDMRDRLLMIDNTLQASSGTLTLSGNVYSPPPSKGGATAVPEPSTWALLLAAGLGLAIVRAVRRRR